MKPITNKIAHNRRTFTLKYEWSAVVKEKGFESVFSTTNSVVSFSPPNTICVFDTTTSAVKICLSSHNACLSNLEN